MKSIPWLVGLLAVCVITAEARAGGPPPLCMAVDKLVFEPNENAPTRIQIWGSFGLLNEPKQTYGDPVRGYLYYKAVPGMEKECQAEWATLKKLVAGKHLVSYGMCSLPKISADIRKPTIKPESPIVFPLLKIEGFRNADPMLSTYPSLKRLRPLSEAQEAEKEKSRSAGKQD